MTDDAMDTTSSPVVSTSDTKTTLDTLNSDTFRKPLALKSEKKNAKRKAQGLASKDSSHIEMKKKKKKPKPTKEKNGDCGDATESVDSGCIADIAYEDTDWPQVEEAVLEERNYVLSLLQWLPDFQWVLPEHKKPRPAPVENKEDEEEDEKEEEKKTPKKKFAKKKELAGTKAMLRQFIDQADEIDNLRDKYTAMLEQLKNERNTKKKAKIRQKLKIVERRNKKNTNRQRKLEQAEICKAKHQAIEVKKSKKSQKAPQMKIFNEHGKLVFSKFDFSSDGSGAQSKKARNLEQKVTQALKEREMRKRLQKEGNLQLAADMKDVDGWASALKKAGGEKAYDDLTKLKKSLKKKETQKKNSKKKWDERKDALEKKMQDRQKKRTDNLNARKEKKLEKQMKKLKKKGRIIPGF